MNDTHVTWIVPCRRAVVKRTITYRELLNKWRLCLLHYRARITTWYGISEQRPGGSTEQLPFDRAIADLQAIISQMDADAERPVSRSMTEQAGAQTGNTFNTRSSYVRLWKGPLRVLLEERTRGSTDPPAEGSADPVVTSITYRGQMLVLHLNRAHREVTNETATFLMGDVVEFPLAAFLVTAGKTAYANISFNPDGSFFCDTVLLEGGRVRSCGASPKLHDNLIAMRFQLLTGMLRGAFYSLSPVFTGRPARAAIAPDPDDTRGTVVHARGIVYGASLANPTSHLNDGYWRLATYKWGYRGGHDLPDNLPSRSGLALLAGGDNPILTNGTSCSPTTLTLSSFMLNLDRWGHNSVQTELTAHPRDTNHSGRWVPSQHSAYWGKFEEQRVPNDELLGITAGTESRQARDSLVRRMNSLRGELGDPRPLPWTCVADDQLEDLSRATRNSIRSSRRQGNAAGTLSAVNQALRDISQADSNPDREAQREEQRIILRRLHNAICDKFRELRRSLQELVDDDSWQTSGITPPELAISGWPADAHPVGGSCTESHGITAASVRNVVTALRDKATAAGNSSTRDALSTLHDINVFSLTKHELSIVKVYPARHLMDRNTLPLSGRMSSYDPLSGVEDFDGTGGDEARLFYLEASGSLNRYMRSNHQRLQACGVQPFKWQSIADNLMSFRMERTGMKYWPGPIHGGGSTISAVFRIRDDVLRGIYPGNERSEDADPAQPEFKPFVIEKPNGDPLGDRDALFAERALPFATLGYATDRGGYPRRADITPYLNTAHTEVTASVAAETDADDRAKLVSFQTAVAPAAAAAGH